MNSCRISYHCNNFINVIQFLIFNNLIDSYLENAYKRIPAIMLTEKLKRRNKFAAI